MQREQIINSTLAQYIYEKELAEQLGIDLNTEHGRQKINDILFQEKRYDIQYAISKLKKENPGKFIRLSEIRYEAQKIQNERLAPYIEKAEQLNKSKNTLTKKLTL